MDIWIFIIGFFKFRPTFVEISSNVLKFHQSFVEISSKCPVSGSPSRVCLCPSCLRRFGDLRKNTPLDCWSMYLVYFVDYCWFFMILPVLRSPSPVRLCRSCLRRFGDLKNNTPLDFWSMHLVDFSKFDEESTEILPNHINKCELNDGWGPHDNSTNYSLLKEQSWRPIVLHHSRNRWRGILIGLKG